VAGQSHSGSNSGEDSAARRIVSEVSAQHADLLAKLRQEIGPDDGEVFAAAAQRLAEEFGSVTATAVDATAGRSAATEPAAAAEAAPEEFVAEEPKAAEEPSGEPAEEQNELASLYRPGHMRRRLDQLVETNRRYGHPFGLAVFDASGPGTRNGDAGGGRETVLAIVGAALRDSIRIVDEAFRLEEDAICVLAPNLGTVEGMQMAERLLGQLDELERAGGLRIAVAAGVVACPDHGADADQLLHKADAALWRARAVGQLVGVGALDPVQDR
jgi:diguanylate cyclase (GGDEF)-like protein